MNRIWNRAGIATSITAITAVSVLVFGGVAHADLIKDSINSSAGITLTVGSSGTARIWVQETGADGDAKCNIDPGEAPLELTMVTPTGVTANPATVAITNCTDEFPVSFTAGTTAVSGVATVIIEPRVGDAATNYVNDVSIAITISRPIPTNTAPSVSVGGVTNGVSYEIGSVPSATCLVVDAEDGTSTSAAVISGTLQHRLGTLTATCDYTDAGGKQATTATATYTIVDTVDPTITFALNPVGPDGVNGWYTTDAGVVVHFTCADLGGSGIADCPVDIILMDGPNHSVTGTATDNAGNTATATASGITVDTVDPTIEYTLSPASPNAAGWYATDVSVVFECLDGGSGMATCVGDETLSDGANQTVTGTATDGAGNTATATASGINIDSVEPTISYTLNPAEAPGTGGWYTSDVTVDFTCTDIGGSGIAECPADITLTDGTHQVTGTATDKAGNTAQAIVAVVNIDSVDPTISYTLNPAEAAGNDGWYTSDVTVDFTCTDVGGSGIAECPADITLTDGAHEVTGAATDNAGNTAVAAATAVNIDSVDPTITYTLSPAGADGDSGWYTSDVAVDFTCTDGGSGIAVCPADTTLEDGTNQSVTGTTTDKAGNTATVTTLGVNIDTVDPTIEYTLSPAEPNGLNGWYTTDAGVVVDFTCTDGGSGVAGCPAGKTLRDGAGQSVTGTATDIAGNTATVTTSAINIDSVDPTIGYTLDPAGANDAGWYSTDVIVAFECLDAGSGIATCVGGATLAEGENQSATGTATDDAGNTATTTVSGIDIDKTAPSAPTFSGGPTGSYYYGNDPAAPTCGATDELSGLASCVVTGGGSAVGDRSYLATATDKAGNTSTSTLAYTVRAWHLTGFYAPVDMGANTWNTVKGGSTVPLKFEIFAGTELTSASAVKSFTATAVSCPNSSVVTDAIEFTTTGGTSLRYDSTAGQFIQNWATPKKPGACVVVTMTTQDGSSISANFKLK